MKRSEELRAGILELGDAITALRRVSSLRGSKARNIEAFEAAGLAYGMAKSRLLPELRARGAQSLDMSAKISWRLGPSGAAASLPGVDLRAAGLPRAACWHSGLARGAHSR